MTDILMPALSPTMEEGNLTKWHVKPGDKIEPGQVIAEIETDKATMEVEAVDEGVVTKLLVEEGAEGVKVNTPIAVLDDGSATNPAPLVGEGREGGRSTAAPVEEKSASRAAPTETQRSERPSPPAPPYEGEGSTERVFASPLARRIAKEEGVDLASLVGTGPHGRIVKADVLAAPKGAPPRVEAKVESQALVKAPVAEPAHKQLTLEQMGIAPDSYRLVPLDLMRKTIARRMTDSFRDVPHFPLTIDLEVDKLVKARGEINARFKDQGIKISVNDMLIKAAALALIRVPEANASYTPDGIALHNHADIAVAVAIPGGLITPIIRTAEHKGLGAISEEMADLAERARARKLKPDEFQGGTFSISNMGMMGIKEFASIINQPHGAIMSVGAAEKRPIVKNDALAIATMMTVTLTCDHRVLDGAIGAAFLKAFRGFVEDPMTMLL